MNYKLLKKTFNLSSVFSTLCFLLTGCGSICRGRTQDVQITSNPSCAAIYVDNVPYGETPQIVQLSRKNEHHIVLIKEGFNSECYSLKPKLSGVVAGNLGCIGIGAGAGFGIGVSGGAATGDGLAALFIGGVGAAIGTAVGTIASVGGIGADIASGGGYNLPNRLHVELMPAY
jgi:hypothetical protein